MRTFKLIKEDAQEVLHKLTILADEPELQEEYKLTQGQAEWLRDSVPHVKGGEWQVPEDFWSVVLGEMENHCENLRNIAESARKNNARGECLRIHKQAARLEKLFGLTI
jgi:hypothetical protein